MHDIHHHLKSSVFFYLDGSIKFYNDAKGSAVVSSRPCSLLR